MKRPSVIIQTNTAIDGNINGMDLPAFEAGSQLCQDLELTPGKQALSVDAYLNG